MENLDNALEVLNLLSKASELITEKPVFYIKRGSVEIVKKFLVENNIETNELLAENEIELLGDFYIKFHIKPYNNITSFFRRFSLSDFDQGAIVILNSNNNDIIVFNENPTPYSYCYPSGAIETRPTNYYYIQKIMNNFFPKFVDYIDTANKKMIFLSPDCGRFEICWNHLYELSNIEKSFSSIYEKIDDIVSWPKGWEYIIKNRIISKLEIIENPDDRIRCLFEYLDNFIEITLKDFELFMISKKHETIINQFEKEIDLFAEKVRSVLERISTSLFSIPITFSAALFGFKDLQEIWLINVFLLSLAVFVIFSCIIQGVFINEIKSLRREMLSKSYYFSQGINFLIEKFSELSMPLSSKMTFLQVLCILISIVFIFLYILLAVKYLDISLIIKTLGSYFLQEVK